MKCLKHGKGARNVKKRPKGKNSAQNFKFCGDDLKICCCDGFWGGDKE
jgi:hypothetical protein